VHINQALEPVVGLNDVRKIIRGILDLTEEVEWKLLNVFGRGNTICTERLDSWDFDAKGWGLKLLKLACIGIFDLNARRATGVMRLCAPSRKLSSTPHRREIKTLQPPAP
jgi:limonene-1,2-epoxide hydrolase